MTAKKKKTAAMPALDASTSDIVEVYLRCVDQGTDNECWFVCAKNDPGAVKFTPAA